MTGVLCAGKCDLTDLACPRNRTLGFRQASVAKRSRRSAAESILYFRVEDIRRAHEQLQERGAEFVQVPHMIHRHGDGTEEWMAFFKDPDGRPLAIMSQVNP